MFALFVKLSYDLHLPAVTGYIPQSTGIACYSHLFCICCLSCEFLALSQPFSSGNFDGQGSGHEFAGTNWHPSSGYVNNCDGQRSHLTCDVRLTFVMHFSLIDLSQL